MLLTLFLFDFLVLCLPRKVQLSVAAVFGDMGCLYSCREKQSPVQLDLMEGLPWTSIRNGTSSCMTQKESRWLFLTHSFSAYLVVVKTTSVRYR